jgi:hypothetical protein
LRDDDGFGDKMKRVVLLITLSIVFIVASRWAAKYGAGWHTRYPPSEPGTYWDMKSIRDAWLLVEVGLIGLGVASFGAALAVYFRGRRIG